MSLKMEMDASGASRAPISVLPAADGRAALRPEAGDPRPRCPSTPADRPRCSSTPCSPIKNTVSGYQILHMDSNYLVGFTTGEELLKLAHKWSTVPSPTPSSSTTTTIPPEKSPVPEALPSPVTTSSGSLLLPRPTTDLAVHRTSRIFKAKARYYQPYDIPAAGGRRRRRMPSSGDPYLRSLSHGEAGGRALHHHGPLPLCLLTGKRAHSKSLDYLNLDKMSLKEPAAADTEVLQYQLQHLTLRGERLFTRNMT